jgi:hypothetical protein
MGVTNRRRLYDGDSSAHAANSVDSLARDRFSWSRSIIAAGGE